MIAILVLGILAGAVILAVNPARSLATARNARRENDLRAIGSAVKAYVRANRGAMVLGLDTQLRMLGTATAGCDVRCGAGNAEASSVVLTAVADTYLQQDTPGTAHGAEDRLQVYPWAPSFTRRALVRFDLSSIPTTASITRATLELFEAGTFGAPRTIAAHRVTSAWSEASATWASADQGVPWSAAGGDFAVTPTALTTLVWDGVLGWFSWDVTADVQSAVSGTTTHFGWLFKDTVEDASQAYWFFEAREGLNRPRLRVDYAADQGELTASACLDVTPSLVSRYLPSLPVDPLQGTPARTQYALKRDALGNLTLKACPVELNTPVEVTL